MLTTTRISFASGLGNRYASAVHQPLRFAVLILLIVLVGLLSNDKLRAEQLSDAWIEEMASPLIKDKIAKGLSIGYIEGNQYGIVHLGCMNRSNMKPDNLTLYEIGSISKVFTSLLLADAVVRREINLDDPIDVENQASIKLPQHDGHSITWLDLSTHRSGLPRLPNNLLPKDSKNPYRDYDSKKAAKFLSQYELSRQSGEKQEYSNFAVSVLGYLIQQNAGKTYDALLKERIAEPLRMTQCAVSLTSDQRKRMATPYRRDGRVTSPWSFADMPGAGGIHANMRDMMRFAKAQLDPPNNQLGKAIELAWQQQTAADNSSSAMGLGWMIYPDGQTRWHNGGTGGFNSAMFINRQLKSAVIVLCNTDVDNEVDQLAIRIINKAAGHDVQLISSAQSDLNEPPKVSPFTAVRFEDENTFVIYDNQEYQWLSLDEIQVESIISAAKKAFGNNWEKRVREDLVEVLWSMSHKPAKTVKLVLRNTESNRAITIDRARMTKENRQAVRSAAKPPAIDEEYRARLVGRYELTPDFIMTVADENGNLTVTATNQATLPLKPDSLTHWSNADVKATLEFKLPKSGSARSLILHQGGAKQTARRIKETAEANNKANDKLAIDADLRSRLEGRYQLAPNFIFTVTDQGGRLMVGVTNQPTLEVFPDSTTKWSYQAVEASLVFNLPKNGPARSLVLHQNGAEQLARRIK